jgi:hypothetical protein
MPRNLPRNIPSQHDSSASPSNKRPLPIISLDTASKSAQNLPSGSNLTEIRYVANRTRSRNPIVQTALLHIGREIPLMCIQCGATPKRKPINKEPAFCTISAAKGKYIAQRQACETSSCNPVGRKGQIDQFMVPQDPTIPFIRLDNLFKVEIPTAAKGSQ